MEIEVDLVNLTTEGDTFCTICDAEFLDPEDLTVHLTQVHASEPPGLFTCHFCPTSLSDLEAYAFHFRDKHLLSAKLCSYCSKTFINADEWKTHERKHYSLKKFNKKCSRCRLLFENLSALELHEYEQHNDSSDGVLLQDYTAIFSSVLNTDLFNLLHPIGSDIYACTCCNFVAITLDEYLTHLQTSDCKSLACNTCSSIFKSKRLLAAHVVTNKKCNYVSKAMKDECECPHCFKKIKPMFYFNHVKQCKPMKCFLCDIVFTSMNDMTEHQSTEHPSSIEVQLCKFCNRQCVGTNSLLKHMCRVHRQEFHLYKYKCVQCNTVFKHPRKLFAHYFIYHKDLEPYTCKICNKKFRIRKRFTLHIKLDHNSVGFVEFDKEYNVFFSEWKSETPFVPTCVIPEEELHTYEKYNEQFELTKKFNKKDGEDNNKSIKHGLNQTETEGFTTDVGVKENNLKRKKVMKRKVNKKIMKLNQQRIPLESSDEDEPLVSLSKRKITPKRPFEFTFKTKSGSRKNKNRLTCSKCNKYCYTFQNYQRHMTLHKKNENKTCIKCSRVFKSSEKLKEHIDKAHMSSKLTETLKMLLEKRKTDVTRNKPDSSKSEKFLKTIKKVKTDSFTTTATIKLVEKDVSLQKFIENFTPEANNDIEKTKNAVIENSITIKVRDSPFYREPLIKMTKFQPKPISTTKKLAMPVKFKQDKEEKVTISMKIIKKRNTTPKFVPHFETTNEVQEDNITDNYEDEGYKPDTVPEMAQEIYLEGSEEVKLSQIPHSIVIPNLPHGCEDLSIAHLQPEAPYYKIVKVNDILKQESKTKKIEDNQKKEVIKLADGTKLVTVNPLAHLLGDRKIEDILEKTKNKYYKPKIVQNVEKLFSKAMEKANTPTHQRKSKREQKTD